MTVDRQMTLLRMAARIDPHLRRAVGEVDEAIAEMSSTVEQLRDALQWLAVWFDKAPVDHFEWGDRIEDLILALPGVDAE